MSFELPRTKGDTQGWNWGEELKDHFGFTVKEVWITAPSVNEDFFKRLATAVEHFNAPIVVIVGGVIFRATQAMDEQKLSITYQSASLAQLKPADELGQVYPNSID